jgi:hypothetical protein
MKRYQLFLDESGGFIENQNGKKAQKPSCVAGYLAEDKECNELWAKSVFRETKNSNISFSKISIDPFHGLESFNNPNLTAFVTALLQRLCNNKSIRLVEFKNMKGLDIVNSNTTYLNVLTEGIIQLIKELLAGTQDEVRLDIIYAERSGIKISEYTERLNERLILQLAAFPQQTKNRFKYTIQWGSAKKENVLMLADAVCSAVRGFSNLFSKEEKEIIRNLKNRPKGLRYSVLENKAWQNMEALLIENRLADFVYHWYIRVDDDKALKEHKDEFKEIVIEKFRTSSPNFIRSQFKLLSQIIDSIINERKYTIANIVMDHLFNDFFPLLEQAGVEIKRHLFDLHFYRLTTCTHQGAVALGNREMQICDELLKKIEWTYEDLEYLLSYKLRKVEQQKNAFDFKGALETLTGMEMLLKESLLVISMVDDLGEFTKNIKSKMLGKVLGSKVAVESYLLDEMPALKELILHDSDKAIQQFTERADIARQYQTRAMAEYKLGNYENAVKALKEAAGVQDDKLMMLVRRFKENRDEFGLMHYANIMALATASDLQIGKEMYEAWNQEDPLELVNNLEVNYPKYVIQWRVATTRFNLGSGVKADIYYKLAIEEALKDVNVPTVYAAGLAIQAEYNGNLHGKEKELELLKIRFTKFMLSNIPQTMRDCFKGWDELITAKKGSKERTKQELLLAAKKIPIL